MDARTRCEDDPVPNSRPLPALLGTVYLDQRPGAVRGGFPSRTGRLVFETREA